MTLRVIYRPNFSSLGFIKRRERNALVLRSQFKNLSAEEVANTITHGFGLVLSVIGFAVLVVLASLRGDGWSIAGCVVYGLSLVILYAASTFYHSTITPHRKLILQIVDHCCIYLLIAGSYTPFLLVVLRSGWGVGMLVFVWTLALLGILMRVMFRERFNA